MLIEHAVFVAAGGDGLWNVSLCAYDIIGQNGTFEVLHVEH